MCGLSRREQVLQMVRREPERAAEIILTLEDKVRELQASLKLNSTNSSKPPSSDGLQKPAPKSLRVKTGRKPGGQPGHRGHTLVLVEEPDHTQIHRLDNCTCGHCGGVSLKDAPVVDYQRRQVVDLPPMRMEVTEHRAEIKRCPISGLIVRAGFPADVKAPAQYGPNFQGLMLYLSNQQLLPFDRLRQICKDLFGQPLSAGTLASINASTSVSLETVERAIIQGLTRASAVNADESGLRVNGKLHWLHVASTKLLTFFGVHPNRGFTAMAALGVLPECRKWLIHDHLKAYYKLDALHALCNQHLLRELKFLSEQCAQPWARELADFLLAWNSNPRSRDGLDEELFGHAHRGYRAILAKGRKLHPRRQHGHGRAKQDKATNLLDRLEDYDLCVLAFLVDPSVPFTNNQAEQDIRMVKVKQKISGCFRSLAGAQGFARIRGYLSTCRKQGFNLHQACVQAAIGQPLMPNLPCSGNST
jgi:transposase